MKQQNKLDPYKRLIRFLTVMVLVLVLTGMFIVVWKRYHNWGIVFPFYHKGYWLMGAFYAFFYFIFMYLMGGMNVGSLRMSNLCLSMDWQQRRPMYVFIWRQCFFRQDL